MRNARFGLTVGIAAAAISLFAATGYGQSGSTPTTDPNASAQTPTNPGATASPQQSSPATGTANTPATASPSTSTQGSAVTTSTRTTATDVTTAPDVAPTSTFALGPVAIVVIALIVVLLLWAMLRPRDRTVVRDNYQSSTTTRDANTFPTNERVVSPRAASNSETTTRTTETDTRL